MVRKFYTYDSLEVYDLVLLAGTFSTSYGIKFGNFHVSIPCMYMYVNVKLIMFLLLLLLIQSIYTYTNNLFIFICLLFSNVTLYIKLGKCVKILLLIVYIKLQSGMSVEQIR